MRAAWYDRRGPAIEVLQIGEMPDVHPGPGEVRIAVSVSGLSPGDIKKREGWQDAPMPFPRVIPHSDGSGIIDAVGDGVHKHRLGTAAWCYGAQSYRAFGTAAQYVVVPEQLAIELPTLPDAAQQLALAEQAACLGIAGITGYRSVFADGPVRNMTVLVYGAVGGVGSIATQMAVRDGARVIAVVREGQEQAALALGAQHALNADAPDLAAAIRAIASQGVQRISDVDFGAHVAVDADVIATGGVICSYFSSADRPEIPYWKFGFADVTIRFLGSDDFLPAVKADAAKHLTAALLDGTLKSQISERVPLPEIARAHDLVGKGAHGRVLVVVDN